MAEDENSGYEINANRSDLGAWEVFTVEEQTGGTYALKTAHGRYLIAESDGKLKGLHRSAGSLERFTPECIGICIFYEN